MIQLYASPLPVSMIFCMFVMAGVQHFWKILQKYLKGLAGVRHWCSHLGPVNRTEAAVLKVFLGILGWDLVGEPLPRLLKPLKVECA